MYMKPFDYTNFFCVFFKADEKAQGKCVNYSSLPVVNGLESHSRCSGQKRRWGRLYPYHCSLKIRSSKLFIFTLFSMLRSFPLAIFLTLSTALSAQFQVGHTSITFMDPARSNRPIQTEIYYPADVAGDNVPLAAGQYPVIQFGHGFVMVWSAYQHFWETYVPQGYILCFPKTEGSFSPSHTEFAKDLAFLCTAMEAEKALPGSLFFGHIQSRYGVMGHSMGGGCSVLAYQYNPDLIQCVATFAPANTNPSAIAVAPEVSVPSLTFAGAYDCIAPPAQQAQLIFDALDPAACKMVADRPAPTSVRFLAIERLATVWVPAPI